MKNNTPETLKKRKKLSNLQNCVLQGEAKKLHWLFRAEIRQLEKELTDYKAPEVEYALYSNTI